tara:strand:- start:2197 stop:2532 length:336 start_codon:yes stop_codon:yes gene_type:complete
MHTINNVTLFVMAVVLMKQEGCGSKRTAIEIAYSDKDSRMHYLTPENTNKEYFSDLPAFVEGSAVETLDTALDVIKSKLGRGEEIVKISFSPALQEISRHRKSAPNIRSVG